MHKDVGFVLSCLVATVWLGANSPSQAASFTVTPAADAFVATGANGNLSGNNYGGGGALVVAAAGLPNGEFQTVMKFDLSGARDSFNGQYGVGQWAIESVTLQLTSSPHTNPIYNNVAAGLFGISLMQNNGWVEGTGTASTPATNGITYATLQSTFISNGADQALGTFRFPGGTSGANRYSLDLSPGLIGDIAAGNELSLRLFAADNSVSYLFSSRATSAAADEPQLIVEAVPEPQTLVLVGLAGAVAAVGRWASQRMTPSRSCRHEKQS
jgi:hypothetical protein